MLNNFLTIGLAISDFGKGLNEVSQKFKSPFGNPKVIADFAKKLQDELQAKEDNIIAIEEQAQTLKKIKANPSPEEEVNLYPTKANTTPSLSSTTCETQQTKVTIPSLLLLIL